MVADLDRDEIEHIDLAISPYHYQTDDRQGVKAYLNKGYFTILQDLLDYKYADDFEE